MVSAGRILIIPKGTWDNLVSYTMLDLVTAPNGVAYLARQASVGVNPVTDESHTYWQAFGTSVTPDGETIVADSNNAIAVNLDNQTLVVDGNVKVNIDDNTLKYDSTNGYLYVELDVNQLANVNLSGLTDGQILTYNATSQKWVNENLATELSSLTDVQITSVTNGQILVYDSTSSKWVNQDMESSGHIILDEDGTAMTEREKLQFVGLNVTDASTKTVVEPDTKVFTLTSQSLTFSNLVATITDSRVTANTYAMVYFHDSVLSAAASAGITVETSANTITFTATSTPSTVLTCDVVCMYK